MIFINQWDKLGVINHSYFVNDTHLEQRSFIQIKQFVVQGIWGNLVENSLKAEPHFFLKRLSCNILLASYTVTWLYSAKWHQRFSGAELDYSRKTKLAADTQALCGNRAQQLWYRLYNPLQWLHNECGGVSNHRRLSCLPKRLFRCRSKKPSKPRATGHCEWNLPVTGGFRSQRTNNAENVIW